ncbi:FAD-dependent thymidylate synthase [Candidatus Woesearchaeota archaeon]|nr:FAD-dependent thymidylate synthase [Candidatus Woesearchaeota archaeon]
MIDTGTFSPLQNEREYTEDEKTVLLHFFTNIDRNVYCAKDALSSQLWAFLMGQYSRTHVSLRDRFLKLFEDAQSAYEEKKITKDEYVSLESLAEAIRRGDFQTLQYFNDKASSFLKKWGVDYGHNSLKDADKIRYALEGISQVYTKIIEAPFPTLGDFQEKSTRYIHFGKESLIIPPKLQKSKYGEKTKKLYDKLMDTYEEYMPVVISALEKEEVINKNDFKNESAYDNTVKAKAFDMLRYLLPTGVATSLGTTLSARTAESHISEMLTSEHEETRQVAKAMHEEGLKISPGLLSRIGVIDYHKLKREDTTKIVGEVFKDVSNDEIIRGPREEQRVKLLLENDMDATIVASILFEYAKQKGISFNDCYKKAKDMGDEEKLGVLEAELSSRGTFDRMPRALQHGTVLFEFLVDFGAYRDLQRHRATTQLWQGATAIHGYDYPEHIDLLGLEELKKDYDEVMTELTMLCREVIKEFPAEAEYVAALGHLIRTTFEMHPGQVAYVTELRTTPQGHQSYRRLFQKTVELLKEKAPLYHKYLRVNIDVEASRIRQEERAAEKKKKLGLL